MYEVKLTEPKGEMGNLTIIVGDFNGPLSIYNRTTRKKMNRII